MLALKALVLCFFPSFTFMGEEDIPTVVPNWPTSHLERLWLVFCGPTLKLFTVLEINTCVLFAFLHERVRQKGRWRQAERHRETDTVTGTPRGGDAENRGGTVAPAAARGEASLWTEDPSCPCLLPLSTVSQKQGTLPEEEGQIPHSPPSRPRHRPSPHFLRSLSTRPSIRAHHVSVHFARFAHPARWRRDCAGRARLDGTRPGRIADAPAGCSASSEPDGAGCPQRER